MKKYISLLFLCSNLYAQDLYTCVAYMASADTNAVFELQDNSDGYGVFISKWQSTLPKPTIQEALDNWTNAVAWKEAKKQASKPSGRKQYENAYFTLVKAVLTLANDPRKDVTPVPKLSFDELDAILDVLYETPATEKKANKLALKLLSVNAALQRYDINWWDSAVWHDL